MTHLHFALRRALSVLSLCSVAFTSPAAAPTDQAGRALLVGQPRELLVQPAAIELVGARAMRQMLVTGRYADGSQRDLTGVAELTSPGGEVRIGVGGFVQPIKNGVGTVSIRVGALSATVPLQVRDVDRPTPVGFRSELIASLNVGGCNMGACHGTPSGKGGFKLSLRGFDPAADYLQLTRDALGRRSDRHDAGDSLVLQKALGRVTHEGGQRFLPASVAGQTLRTWLHEGLQDDAPTTPVVRSIAVLPGSRVLSNPARWQQLAVLASFSDGSVRDVTRLTVFSSSDVAVAEVNTNGLVEFKQAGEIAILCRYLEQLQTVRLTYLEPRKNFNWPNPVAANYVDQLVFAKLKLLSLPPSDLCTDQDFIRRAYLDVCGMLPSANEVRQFLNNHDAGKRAKLIDALLQRPEYADFWTLKWSDVLRSNRKVIQVKGTHVFQQWLRDHLERNTGFDEVVRELLTSNGSTSTNPPANYYRIARDPQNLAETTAQLFFGVRMQCAKCHNHPFERWTQDDYYSMAAFFARVRQKQDVHEPGPTGAEVIYSERGGEVVQPRTGKVMAPKFMGGAVPTVPAHTDRRDVLAAWIASEANPFFAKSVANRIWYHLCGKGIVDPVDDFRDSNPSCNDELLEALAKDFASSHFDVKHLIRAIMNSRTYQLSAQANDFNADDNKYFSHAVTKLLTAEQLLDALSTVTEVAEKFPGMPTGTRATQLPDGDVNHPFLKTFGQPARELACECERESDSNLAQALQLINGPTVNDKLRNPKNHIGRLLAAKTNDSDLLIDLYLSTLSRPPTEADAGVALSHLTKASDKRKAWEDIHWALINSKEFLFRH